MDTKIVFPSIFLIFICLFENSSCIQCFQCNTGVDAHCDDPFSYLPGRSYLYHCPDDDNENEYFCQKMVFTENGVHRVQRSCQHIRQDQSYYGWHTNYFLKHHLLLAIIYRAMSWHYCWGWICTYLWVWGRCMQLWKSTRNLFDLHLVSCSGCLPETLEASVN